MWESEGMARCDTWYEFLASYLLYSEPFVRRSHLGPLATKCYDSWPTTNKHLDQTLLAIMQQDLHQVKYYLIFIYRNQKKTICV